MEKLSMSLPQRGTFQRQGQPVRQANGQPVGQATKNQTINQTLNPPPKRKGGGDFENFLEIWSDELNTSPEELRAIMTRHGVSHEEFEKGVRAVLNDASIYAPLLLLRKGAGVWENGQCVRRAVAVKTGKEITQEILARNAEQQQRRAEAERAHQQCQHARAQTFALALAWFQGLSRDARLPVVQALRSAVPSFVRFRVGLDWPVPVVVRLNKLYKDYYATNNTTKNAAAWRPALQPERHQKTE